MVENGQPGIYMSGNIDHLISPDEQAAIRQPIEKARTLPRQAFVSRDVYNLETERIYSRHWVAAVFTYDAESPGDVMKFDVCGMPFIAVRGTDNTLRTFHNICPYDGCPVVMESTRSLEKLVVPYHGWEYSLDGKLVAMPYWNGHEDCGPDSPGSAQGDLNEVKSVVWHGILFINLSDNAEPFNDYIQPVINLLEEYNLEKLEIARDQEEKPFLSEDTIDTNWKTYCENACLNVLHESFTHRMYNESSDVPRVDGDGNRTFQPVHDGTLIGFSYNHAELTDTYPEFPCPPISGTGKPPPKSGYFLTLYPNLYLVVMPNIMEIGIALPDGPDKTIDMRGYYCHKSSANNPALVEAFDEFAEMFEEAAREDNAITEAIQKARRSPVCAQQYFSPFWDEPHYNFTRLVLDDLTLSD